MQEDEYGKSKYIIYPDNFKYVQETDNAPDFSIWGKYNLTDSTIVFTFQDNSKIPYYYFRNNISKKSKSEDGVQVQVVSKSTNEPILMAQISLLAANFEPIVTKISDFDGIAIFPVSSKVEWVEVSYLGHGTTKYHCTDFSDHDLLIELEEWKMGGRLEGSCLLQYIDVLLEYDLNKQDDLKGFYHGDVVYEKLSK